jgi:hypothetical protein
MRDGLDAPTLELSPTTVQAIRSFLEAQSRIELAVWVRHEQHGPEGAMYDHHLVLGVDDEDWASGDMRALEHGLEMPALDTREPTWIDIFPVSEVATLRAFGTVLWEQTSLGGDSLDYRFTYEPFTPEPEPALRFAELLAEQPAIRRVGATVETLWKAGDVVEESIRLVVDAPPAADVLKAALDAARTSVLAGRSSYGASLGSPEGDRMTVLYEAAT